MRFRLKAGEVAMLEIKFRGRGGQGAVVASEILGKCFFLEGKYPQAFSLFGGERRGAPVFGFLRVDDKPILLKCQIKNPDHVIIFDLSLADQNEILGEIKPGGTFLVNTEHGIEHFQHLRKFRVGLIDASGIATSAGLGHTFNTAVLGAYAKVAGLVKIDTLASVIGASIPSRADTNIQAARLAYDQVKIYPPEEMN
jgi:2-oxoacid:acceptor oxidoreductase gamma subunit (pyruvate/2-ketoisovalerate family)